MFFIIDINCNRNKFVCKCGYYNEFDFANELNEKFVYQLNNNFISMLYRIYDNKLNQNDYVLCWKSFKTDKADIVISINNKYKYISIKNGKNNSVHLEPLSDFICFLKDNNISDELIKIYYNYHYASDEFGNRISAKEYQVNHLEEIILFNKVVNKKRILLRAINRFLFEGTHSYNNKVNGIIYGNIDNFVYVSYSEVVNYLLNETEDFCSVHFSLLTLQPWTRNLNFNKKYEYRRDYVQVKWYRLEETIEKIIKKRY